MPVFSPQKFRTSFKALKNPMKSLKNNPSDGLPYYLQYIFVWFLPRILLQKASTPLGHMEASHACFQSCTCLQHHLSSVHPSFVAAAFQLSESQFQPAKKKCNSGLTDGLIAIRQLTGSDCRISPSGTTRTSACGCWKLSFEIHDRHRHD
jgi:hypothetical protein